MARNRQAFAQLKRTINSSGFVAAAGTPAGNYLAWLKNEREKGTPKATRVTAASKGRLRLGLVPFSSTVTTIDATTIRQSGYITVHSALCVAASLVSGGTAPAEAARFGTGEFTKAELGAIVPDAVTQENAGFYSSQLVVRAVSKESTAKRQVTSGITGRKYSYREAAVATVPFGRSSTEPTANEQSRYRALVAQLEAGKLPAETASMSYSLNNEVTRGQRKAGSII